jgi:DNA-binding MarR family transcriptional regulator
MSNRTLPLPALEIRDRCLCFAAQRAARTLARRFDRAFQPFGITSNQFSLMTALSGPRSPQLSQLAPFLAMDRTTLTAALKALEKRGLATVAPDEKDRRIKRPRLSDAGRAILATAVPVWRAEHDALDAGLHDIQPAKLRQMLADLATVSYP